MGRRLNVSTPTVINTELVPLDDSFYLDVDGQMEQWYYDNTEQYAPNRKVTPLLLVPVISAFDKDTSTSYNPAFNTTQWFANEWNESQSKYVETEITNQVDSGSADYVIQGNNLLVKKNVSYSHAVTIRCVATYIDPRDSGVTYTVEDSVNLTTNRTADVVFPEVDIISPSGRAYNPLVDDTNSQYDFKGVTTNNPVQPLNTDVRRYSVDVDGTEEILNSGEAVAPIMDIRYGENPTMEDQEFMYRQTAGGTLVGESIDKAYIECIKGNTIAWNQLVDTNATEVTPVNGRKICTVIDGVNSIITSDGSAIAVSGGTDMVFDLTLIYGAGNEPTTLEQFEADYQRWFGKPLTYEEYDAGSLRPVLMQSVKTTGFNQWDEEWENGTFNTTTGANISNSQVRTKNLIRVLPNTDYYINSTITGSGGIWVMLLDNNGDVIPYNNWSGGSQVSGNSRNINGITLHTSNNAAYLKFYATENYGATYNHDICINISNPSKNGTYEPYEKKVQGFDVTAIKGKLNGAGESVTIFPDGLKKAGNIQDEIFVENGVVKAIKRVGSVDLGSLTWGYTPFSLHINGNIFRASIQNAKNNVLCCCVRYVPSTYPLFNSLDKSVCIAQLVGGAMCNVADSSYTDADTFKAAMNGVMLYYELAEPETYVLDPITDFVWYGIKNGQEVLADTLPWYVSGQGTDNLVVDAMYGENINVVLRCKMMDGETLSPSKAYATLSWRTPDIETFVQSDNGGAVRGDTEEMSFGTIVNVNGEVLSDALKRKHLAFNWKIRKNNTSTEIDKGWGQRITIDASDLRNVKGSGSTLASTLVSNDVYLKGAYEEVTDNGEVVTYNCETVYSRQVD